MARRDMNGNANGSGGAARQPFGRQFRIRANVVPLWRQRGLCRTTPGQLPARSGLARIFIGANSSLSWTMPSATIAKTVQGPRWKQPSWPAAADGELVSALDGNWTEAERRIGAKLEAKAGEGANLFPAEVQRTTQRMLRVALMMIRAYRIRGHLHANLDPLGIEPPKDHEELNPAAYGFTEADYNRNIFIDGVLGLQFATIPRMLKILRRTYCGTIGFEFMHIYDPAQKSWLQRRIEGPGKGNNLHQGR